MDAGDSPVTAETGIFFHHGNVDLTGTIYPGRTIWVSDPREFYVFPFSADSPNMAFVEVLWNKVMPYWNPEA